MTGGLYPIQHMIWIFDDIHIETDPPGAKHINKVNSFYIEIYVVGGTKNSIVKGKLNYEKKRKNP